MNRFRLDLPRPMHCGRETHSSCDYCWDNSNRYPKELLVIQRTMGGRVIFTEGELQTAVGVGHAMLFSHDEASGYHYPEDADEPYTTAYITFEPAGGFAELFASLRERFGSVVAMAADGEASNWMSSIRHGMRHGGQNSFQLAEASFRLLLAIYREQTGILEAGDPLIRVRRRIEEDFRQPIQIKQLAAESGISREHLIRRFRILHGETPGALLHRLRMRHAQSLRHNTRMNNDELARNCGYLSAISFQRAFRKYQAAGEQRTTA